MNKTLIAIACGVTMGVAGEPSRADATVDALRHDLEQLRHDYEARVQMLEQRLLAAETAARRTELENRTIAEATAPADSPVGAGRGAVTGNRFNPAISAVVQTKLGSYSAEPAQYSLPGFQLGGESGLTPSGFSLDETELTLSANVDPQFYGEVTLGFHEDEAGTAVDIEEAFFDSLGLPGGLGVRAGRFYSGIGYLNHFHTHAWDFHDAPLVYRAMLGDQYGDDGVQLTWLAPTDLYFQLGAEWLQGKRFPGGDSSADFGDGRSLFARLGGDAGVSHSWRLGLSGLWMDARDRSSGDPHGNAAGGTSFSGDSDLAIADFIWKWAPNGNPRQRNFTLQSEYFYRDEAGAATFTEDAMTAALAYQGIQQGWYAQGVYQFAPR